MNMKLYVPLAAMSMIPWGFALRQIGPVWTWFGCAIQVIGLAGLIIFRKRIWW